MHPRLFLVTPPSFDPESFAPLLKEALSGGDVASLLICGTDMNDAELQKGAAALTPIAQKAGAAVMIANNTRVAGRVQADGVHIDGSIDDLKLALETFHPDNIVGAAGARTRHEAMVIAETGIDYIFFGRLDLDDRPEAHPKTLTFSSWWAEVFETPCVAMGGDNLDSVTECAATGAEFVALSSAVWNHPDGPKAAVAAANATLATFTLAVAED